MLDRELVFGVDVAAMPPNYVALEVLCLVKVIDEEGATLWLSRASQGMSDAECIGMLHAEGERRVRHYASCFESEEEEGGDDDDAA